MEIEKSITRVVFWTIVTIMFLTLYNLNKKVDIISSRVHFLQQLYNNQEAKN